MPANEELTLMFIGILARMGEHGSFNQDDIEQRGYVSKIASAMRLAINGGDTNGNLTCVEYPVEDWRAQVAEGKCYLGYWQWVFMEIMMNRVAVVSGTKADFDQLTPVKPNV